MDETSTGVLSAEIWLREMQMLIKRCRHDSSRFEDRIMRKAFHLAVLSPPPYRQMLNVRLTERELEMWLDLGDIEHVARSIAGADVQVAFINATEYGCYRAALFNRPHSVVSAEGASPALAILGAWASSLIRASSRKPGLIERLNAPFRSLIGKGRSRLSAENGGKRKYSNVN